MKHQPSAQSIDLYCTVQEQKHLVSEMTRCDEKTLNNDDRYECYLGAVRKSRENNACMYA